MNEFKLTAETTLEEMAMGADMKTFFERWHEWNKKFSTVVVTSTSGSKEELEKTQKKIEEEIESFDWSQL